MKGLSNSTLLLAALGAGSTQERKGAGASLLPVGPDDQREVRRSIVVPTTESLRAGEFMDRAAVDQIVDLSVGQSGWLSACSVAVRSQRKGEIPLIDLAGPVMEHTGENAGRTITTSPTTDRIPYVCELFQATYYVTWEDVREARVSGDPDFLGTVTRMFTKAVGNDLADLSLNGNKASGTATRRARLLKGVDGWLVQARSRGHRFTTERGKRVDRQLYMAMMARMPERYRRSEGLRWFYSSILDLSYTELLQAAHDATGSSLGQRAMEERRVFTPLNIAPLLVPQMPTDQGYSTLSGATVAADDVAVNADGGLDFRVNSLLGGADKANRGRVVRIRYNGNGQTEQATVTWDGTHNVASSVGTFGQGAPSTNAADYTLDVADTTPIMLTHPRNLGLVICDEIQAFRKWEQEHRRWRVDLFMELVPLMFNGDAVVLQEGVLPTYDAFSSW